MSGQKVSVHLKVPVHPLHLREELEAAGFEVVEVIEVRGGIFAAVDIASFVVEYIDDVVIAALANVVAALLTRAKRSGTSAPDKAGFTVEDSERSVSIQVAGDGNFVQVHPRPQTPDEEE